MRRDTPGVSFSEAEIELLTFSIYLAAEESRYELAEFVDAADTSGISICRCRCDCQPPGRPNFRGWRSYIRTIKPPHATTTANSLRFGRPTLRKLTTAGSEEVTDCVINLITSVACISHDNLQSVDPTGCSLGSSFRAASRDLRMQVACHGCSLGDSLASWHGFNCRLLFHFW